MEAPCSVRLELASRPECISLVRGMLAGVAEPLKLEPELVDDLKTAVAEACNNVALHAYEGAGSGPLVVTLCADGRSVVTVVRDWGAGLSRVTSSRDRLQVGFALISSLADRAQFSTPPDGGTEVRMVFDRVRQRGGRGLPEEKPGAVPELQPTNGWRRRLHGDVVVTLAPVELLAGVFGRLARALAASAGFTLDRFSDVHLVTDAVAAHARELAGEPAISFAVAAGQRRLEIVVGPFAAGSASRLEPARGCRHPLLGLLADELCVERTNDAELLRLLMRDPRSAGR